MDSATCLQRHTILWSYLVLFLSHYFPPKKKKIHRPINQTKPISHKWTNSLVNISSSPGEQVITKLHWISDFQVVTLKVLDFLHCHVSEWSHDNVEPQSRVSVHNNNSDFFFFIFFPSCCLDCEVWTKTSSCSINSNNNFRGNFKKFQSNKK